LFAGIFFISAASVFFAAKKMKKMKVLGKDINKQKEIFLPEATGIALLVPLWIGIFIIIAFENFNTGFFVLGLAVSGYSIIGLLDDLKKKYRGSLSWKARAIPVCLFSLAFSFLFAPHWALAPLLAAYIVGLAALQNTFAGLNGWEVGSGFIISCFVAILLVTTQFFLLAIVFSAAILGLLFWNFFPAKVFPGDSGTLLMGGMIGTMLVLTANMLLMATVFMFYLPHLIDFFALKLRTNKKDLSQKAILPYAILENGKLGISNYPDKKERLDFAKLIIKIFGPMKEWQIVAIIWLIVFLNCLFWFLAFLFARNIIW
jgi:UDP-N-acetylglucosamine--dolichyl-phosphate N-acetylglucosaminephosphotransferase